MSNTTNFIETIKAGLADEVDELTRQRARKACDDLAAVLQSEPGEPLVLPVAPGSVPMPAAFTRPPGVPQPQVNPSLLLDALIAKLRAELPADTADDVAPERARLRIPFVPFPQR